MPRYFFHLYDDLDVIDHEGTDLPNDDAALEMAFAEARTVAADQIKRTGRLTLSHRIEVTEDGGRPVASVKFREAVTVEA